MLRVAVWLTNRHVQNTNFLRDVHSRIVEGAKLAKDILEERKAEERRTLGRTAEEEEKESKVKYRWYTEKQLRQKRAMQEDGGR